MRKIFLSALSVLLVSVSFSQIGIGTTTPDSSAIVDISSQTKGLLIPRVALTATNVMAPITTVPATGLLVYNTATAGVSPYNVITGFYYWKNNTWFPVSSVANNLGDIQYWDGTKWIILPIGPEGSVLTVCNGVPRWGGCPVTTLQPTNNLTEVFVNTNNPGMAIIGSTYLWAGAWTTGGEVYGRFGIKFDLTSIPANAVIDSARFSLYSVTAPVPVGNGQDAQYGSDNTCSVQRITTNWAPSSFTWNTQPATTATNQATILQSVTSFDDALNINVTGIVKDMMVNGNYGFLVKMNNESIYRIRQYVSSYGSNAAKHPKLVVYWH